MKLTEAKLKQMIVEALRNSSFRSFGIPTPDEKLRADLGDEMFDKIQLLDPEQRDIMKQSFDPNYPRELKWESFEDLLGPLGWHYANRGRNLDKTYWTTWRNDIEPYHATRTFNVSYDFKSRQLQSGMRQTIRYWYTIRNPLIGDRLVVRSGSFVTKSSLFDYDFENEEDRETVESLIILKEKENILQDIENTK